MHISSWYGVGTTLTEIKKNDPAKYRFLKDLQKYDDFTRYILTNVDTSLAATDEEILQLYAGLVEEKEVRELILGMILEELRLTRASMLDLLGSPLEKRRINHYHSTRLRADALLPLHREQVKLLGLWRNMQGSGDEEEILLQNLLRSVNAIANAMGTTG
jgi:phosphoenolpyruvate carboxylase